MSMMSGGLSQMDQAGLLTSLSGKISQKVHEVTS